MRVEYSDYSIYRTQFARNNYASIYNHQGLVLFMHSHWTGIYNLANHNDVPPAKSLLGKLNLDFPIQLGAHKIAVKTLKILTLKTQNWDGNQPSRLCQSVSYTFLRWLPACNRKCHWRCFVDTFIVSVYCISVNC